MNVEIIKLRKEQLPNGNIGQIMDIEDFKRLFIKYKITLDKFLGMGLSRAIWNNTLLYYKLGVNDLEGFRNYKESKHARSYYGFSSIIDVEYLGNSVGRSEFKTRLKYLDNFFPGIHNLYFKYKYSNPHIVRNLLFDISRELIDLLDSSRVISRVIKKWAIKNKKPIGKNIIHSKLEHYFSKIMDEVGLSYRAQYRIGVFVYDFKIKKSKYLIEIDGGYHKTTNDIKKEKVANKKGYTIIRFKPKSKGQLKIHYEYYKSRLLGIKDSL